MKCKHEKVSRGSNYDYCEQCGAVRRNNQHSSGIPGEWHTCNACKFQFSNKPVTKDEVEACDYVSGRLS